MFDDLQRLINFINNKGTLSLEFRAASAKNARGTKSVREWSLTDNTEIPIFANLMHKPSPDSKYWSTVGYDDRIIHSVKEDGLYYSEPNWDRPPKRIHFYEWIIDNIPESKLPRDHLYAGRLFSEDEHVSTFFAQYDHVHHRFNPKLVQPIITSDLFGNPVYHGLHITLGKYYDHGMYASSKCVTEQDLLLFISALERNEQFSSQIVLLNLDYIPFKTKIVFPENLKKLGILSINNHVSDLLDDALTQTPDFSRLHNLKHLDLRGIRFRSWPILPSALESLIVGYNYQYLPPALPRSLKYYIQGTEEPIPDLSHKALPNLIRTIFTRKIVRDIHNLSSDPRNLLQHCISSVSAKRHYYSTDCYKVYRVASGPYSITTRKKITQQQLEEHFGWIIECIDKALQVAPNAQALAPFMQNQLCAGLRIYFLLHVGIGMPKDVVLPIIEWGAPNFVKMLCLESAKSMTNLLLEGTGKDSIPILFNYKKKELENLVETAHVHDLNTKINAALTKRLQQITDKPSFNAFISKHTNLEQNLKKVYNLA